MTEKMSFVADNLACLEARIRLLNGIGLFDEAKMFETFAAKACSLYFGQSFRNLNQTKTNFPCVDLVSDDRQIYVQVSTRADVLKKIKDTLADLRDSKKEFAKSVNRVVFFVLSNDDASQLARRLERRVEGRITFDPARDIITAKEVLQKAQFDPLFLAALYEFFQAESDSIKSDEKQFENALKDSEVKLGLIEDQIGELVSIDRSDMVGQITKENFKNIVILGEAGSGKSVLCKMLAAHSATTLYIKADQLIQHNLLDQIWGFNVRSVFSRLGSKPLMIVIDSLEFVADNHANRDILDLLFDAAGENPNIRIVASCRTLDWTSFYKIQAGHDVCSYTLSLLSDIEIKQVLNNFPGLSSLIGDSTYKPFLRVPLYLDLVVKNRMDLSNIDDVAALRNKIWQECICLNDPACEKTVRQITIARAKAFQVGVRKTEFPPGQIRKLISKGVLVEAQGLVRLKFDIFEDVCFEQLIDEAFSDSKGNNEAFFAEISAFGKCAERRYRIWVENKLLGRGGREKFLSRILFGNNSPSHWKEQTIIGLCKSNFCSAFFDEFGPRIVDSGLLEAFVGAINLFSYERLTADESLCYPLLKPVGAGRLCVAKIIGDNLELLQGAIDGFAVAKLCRDLIAQNLGAPTKELAANILTYYASPKLSEARARSDCKVEALLKELLKGIFSVPIESKRWVIDLLSQARADFVDGSDSDVRLFAKDIIKLALSMDGASLFRHLPDEMVNLLSVFYTHKRPRGLYDYGPSYLRDIEDEFGLNSEAKEYGIDTARREPLLSSGIYPGLLMNYFPLAERIMEFVNSCVASLHQKKPLSTVTVRLDEGGDTREFFASSELWQAFGHENQAPTLISDLLFFVWKATTDIADSLAKDKQIAFLNRVREMLYLKSNNVAWLALVAFLGFRYGKSIPGFAMDLCSSVDLVLFDLDRTAAESPLISRLENSVFDAMGIPSALRRPRYIVAESSNNLLEYFRDAQIYGNDAIKKRCKGILDYLRSVIPNNQDNAERYLRIENMDMFSAKAYQVSEDRVVLVPAITGSAKELVERQEGLNEPTNQIGSKIASIYKSVQEGTAFASDELLEIIHEMLEQRESLPSFALVSENLIPLIAVALKSDRISESDRAWLCKSWINESGSFSAQSNWQMYPVLFSQLFMPVPIETKEAIKRFMLESLLENGRSPTSNKAYPSAKAFLQANKSLSTAFINTILALAKDEMGHQKYNALYVHEHRLVSSDEFAFEPNITPNLLGVDKEIAERRGKPFPSEKEAIIEKYLCREEPYNEPIISLDDYSVSILTATLDCGSGLDDPIVAKVASMILGYFFEIHASPAINSSYHLFDAYKQETLRSLLQSELMQGELASESAFALLFDRNLTVVPREVRDFYFDVFSPFSNEYFHAFKDKSRRALLSRLYRTLEKRIKEIGDERARNELERCLVFAPPRFSSIDNLKNKECGYSFEDKEFLCELYGKYGWRHFKDMLTSLYRFHYKDLLPAILVPLASAMQEAEDKIPGALRKEVLSDETGNEKYFLLQIASIALVDFEKKIKEDIELEEAFLTLLRKLVDFGFAEAAVMEDEFLIH